MTNEKMLDIMVNIRRGIYVESLANKIEEPAELCCFVNDTIDVLKEDIREELQKKKGNGKRDAVLKKMMKTVARDNLKYWHPVGEQYAFLDGFRLYVLNDNFGYESITEHIELGEPYNIISREKLKEYPIKIKIDLVELQLWIKEEKAEAKASGRKILKPYVIETPEIKIGFDARFLLEILQMMNTDEINCSTPISPAAVENEAGEWGLLLPIRLRN